jgi:hypothetical protein
MPGWTWGPKADRWEASFEALREYVDQFGSALPPKDYVNQDNYALGAWVAKQRHRCTNLDRRERLQALPGWSWNTREAQWEEGFEALSSYTKQHGAARPPQTFVTDSGYKLGQWVAVQRGNCKNKERRKRLESLHGWAWRIRGNTESAD